MKNLKKVATGLAVEPLRALLSQHPEWFLDIPSNLRNRYPGTAHAHTRSILIRWCWPFTEERAFSDTVAVNYPCPEALRVAVAPLVSSLTVDGDILGRVMVNSLPPGGVITPHRDEGAYAAAYERVHVVIQEGGFLRVGDAQDHETAHMRDGEAWWFDHRARHEYVNQTNMNGSQQDRIHLIVDLMTPRWRTA